MSQRYLKQWQQSDVQTTHATPGTAKVFLSVSTTAQAAMVAADDGNTDDVVIGPTSAATFYKVPPGGVFNIPMPPGMVFDLADWFTKSDGVSQSFVIAYLP